MSDELKAERSTHIEGSSLGLAGARDTIVKGTVVTAIALSFGGLAWWSAGPSKKLEAKPAPQFAAPFEKIVEKVVLRPTSPDQGTVATVVEPSRLVAPSAPSQAEIMLESARRSPVTAFSKTIGSVDPVFPKVAAGETQAEDKGAFEQRLTAPRLTGVKAGLIGNRDMVIAMGTSIPCVLETALQSDQPGFTSCVIDRDVLSDNAHVVLMEKGTQVVGEYRGGLKLGQARLHVVWSRAKTPTGVVIELASAATDGLGRAGVGGTVDTHFMERFGSAILLSVVSDLTKIASSAIQTQSGYSANGTANSGKDAAAIAVEQTAAMVPTLHKNQGDVVSIFVARDLDFSSVYRLALVKSHAGLRTVGARSVKD